MRTVLKEEESKWLKPAIRPFLNLHCLLRVVNKKKMEDIIKLAKEELEKQQERIKELEEQNKENQKKNEELEGQNEANQKKNEDLEA